MQAEREAIERYVAAYLHDKVGATIAGRIVGVTRFGLFVKLTDTGADGLIPIRSLGTEYFNYDETRHALVGSRSGSMHKLGDVVEVRLVEAVPLAGALRFELLSGGHAGSRDPRPRSGRNRKGPRGPQGAGQPKVHSKAHPGRKPRKTSRKPGKSKVGKPKKGKS
jgi:ribonuclease R